MTIYCCKCKRYLGEIKDAKLRKGTKYICKECDSPEVPEFLSQLFGVKK